MRKLLFTFGLFGLMAGSALFVSSCGDKEETPEPVAPASLYDRLGKIEAISAVIDQFLTNVVADQTLSCPTCDFAPTIASPARVRLLRLNLIDQVCQATGGPCIYKGLSMRDSHPQGSVTEAEFNALVGALVASLNQFNVPQKEQDELIAILASLKGDIVY